MTKKTIAIILFGLVASFLGGSLISYSASALANKKDFNPGHIIDDAVFYNSGSMTASQVQKFLESKNPKCDYDGTKPASDWGYPELTHAKFAEYKRNGSHGIAKDTGFHAPPYKCLTRYTQTTPQMEAASSYCEAISAGERTAAEIIVDIARACGINPQVLVILLEKEQSLVTDSWPLNRQLRNATGFACPDTAPCNPAYEGFFYQVYYAARQFKIYQAQPNSYNYRANRDNNIYWHPDLSRCGSSTVFIENQATAALYIYTPYRPNSAALNNLYGLGDSCSSYGNRNFWRIFTDWFGSTTAVYEKMDKPRWMTVSENLQKIDFPSGEKVGMLLNKDMELFFTSKVTINGTVYLRTRADTESGLLKGVALKDLNEISIGAAESDASTWMIVTTDTRKVDPITEKKAGSVIPAGTVRYYPTKYTIGGTTYMRTQHSKSVGDKQGIPLNSLASINVQVTPLNKPTWYQAKRNTQAYNALNAEYTNDAIKEGSLVNFSYKLVLGDQTYFVTDEDAVKSNTYKGYLEDDFSIANTGYIPLERARWFEYIENTNVLNGQTLQASGANIIAGSFDAFSTKKYVNGSMYLRTEKNSLNNKDLVIPYESLETANTGYINLEKPRKMIVAKTTQKLDGTTLQRIGMVLKEGMNLYFPTKKFINGNMYLRTEADTNSNADKVMPFKELRER